jgi:hypothetical protein
MKPINYNDSGCDPISSNCIIWQGPDLDCISLCKGDNISNVIHKLAIELCELMDTFKISNFDLSCLDLEKCTPKDFKELIQLLIEKICEIENVSPSAKVSGGCPDCEVTIAECFYYDTPTGGTGTTLQLKDYVLAVGAKICGIVGQISTIQNTLVNHEGRIETLENAVAPPVVFPQITPTCVLPAVATDLDTVLIALETQFCTLQTATGDQIQILTALQAACAGLNTSIQLSGIQPMSDLAGWNTAPANLAQSFSNLWKVVCDMRNAVSLIQNNCCDTSCASIDLGVNVTVIDTQTIRITYSGTIPNNFIDNNPASTIVILDSAGNGPQTFNSVDIKSLYYDTGQYFEVNLAGPNGSNDIYVATTYRFLSDTGETCTNTNQAIGLGVNTCPDLILTADYTAVNYTFTWNGTIPTLVTMELYNGAGTSLISQQSLNITSTNPSGGFNMLTENTLYSIRIVINGTACDFETFNTLTYACVAPALQPPSLNYNEPSGDQTGKTIEQWVVDYEPFHPE